MLGESVEVVFMQHRRGWRKIACCWCVMGWSAGGRRVGRRAPAVSFLHAHVLDAVAPVAVAGGAADGADAELAGDSGAEDVE